MSEQHCAPSGATHLRVPAVPARAAEPSGPVAFGAGHHFTLAEGAVFDDLVNAATAPLSVILQVTKRCNFDCDFCSEIAQQPDPTLAELEQIRDNLAGVARVFLSGGEPLMRPDFGDVADAYHEAGFVLGIPTNATRAVQHSARMVGKISYINVGLEGPRSTTNRVRGDYDAVMAGVRVFQEHGLPLSLSAVVQRSYLHALPFTVQIADVLDAGKVKLIMPLRKGNALDLDKTEFISNPEAVDLFGRLTELRAIHGWRPAIRLTMWTPDTEGHMICIEPNGNAQAWPVYDAPDLWEYLGNVHEEPIGEIWKRYRFKRNHYAKYLGQSIRTAGRVGDVVESQRVTREQAFRVAAHA